MSERIEVADRTEVTFIVDGQEINVSIRSDNRGRPCLRVRGDACSVIVVPVAGNGVDIRPEE